MGLAINLPVIVMHSITWRITGLMFLSILITVLLLVYLANYQMTAHFKEYLALQHIGMMYTHGPAALSMMGSAEQSFLESIHRSLYWVGGIILLIGLFVSYLVAQSITVPIRKLVVAVEAISAGKYGQKVNVDSRSEVGKLAKSFNQMSQSLADSVKRRQQFLADIVHELRTPLAIIQGNLEGMMEGVVEKSGENLNSLYEESNHLSRMIKDLRDLSLAEAGQLVLEKEPTDMNSLIHRAMNMLEPLCLEKQISLRVQTETVPEILVDVRRINQVLYNLLTNAIFYTPQNGAIRVSTELAFFKSKEWLQISIRDTGCGVALEDLPHIFDHFYRADKSRDKKSGGSGIGLAIVKQLVEIHGGIIEASSELGNGSCFCIYLPLMQK